MDIQIIKGNLLDAKTDYICHQVNCKGVMGAGLAYAIRKAYPDVYSKYRYACLHTDKDLLGCVQIIGHVVNIFGQRNYGTQTRQTCYEALKVAFAKLHNKLPLDKSLAFPYGFGCGLAGGDWNIVYNLIKTNFPNRKIEIYKL
jgi:O-acetyl-ADP-ribose deacetylase (regulator of RNase III)